MRERRTYVSLFSGYGGLDLAVEALTGAEMAAYAEINPASSRIMAGRWPGVPNLGDVSVVDWSEYAGTYAIAAGFPCQDISNAGSRKGITGERSGLWSHVVEAVRVVRPRFVFLENVAAIKSRGLDVVAQDLAAIGYVLRWTCVRASDRGAPHHRDGWFGLSYPAGARGELPPDPDRQRLEVGSVESAREKLPSAVGSGVGAEDADCSTGAERRSSAPGQAQSGGHGPTLDDEVSFLLPDPDSIGREGWGRDESGTDGRGESADSRHSPSEWWGDYLTAVRRWETIVGRRAPSPTETGPRGGRRLTSRFAEWMMGLVDGWVTDPDLELTRSQQLTAIGNGVVPAQAADAYRFLMSDWPDADA